MAGNLGLVKSFLLQVRFLVGLGFATRVLRETSLIQRAETSMKRINEFLNVKSEIINNSSNKISKIKDIEFKNVSLIYKETSIKAINI